MLVDSHCHLDFPTLIKDREGILRRAAEAGVTHMVNIGTTRRDFDTIRATAEANDNVTCSFGIHPDHVHEDGEVVTEDDLLAISKHPKVVGLGETGLDYFHKDAPVDMQKESFRRHLRVARATGLPVIIHSRQAEDDTASMLQEGAAMNGAYPLTGVLHCFSSKRSLGEAALKIGFYVSLSGILTFKKADELRDIVKDIPLNRLLVETDSPYLSPEPMRGRICEPSYVAHTARFLAALKGVSFDEVAKQTTENFFTLFPKAATT